MDDDHMRSMAQQHAEFAWYQRERPRMMREIATRFRCWEICQRSACRRGKVCLAEHAGDCIHARLHHPMSEGEVQVFFVALELYKSGMTPRAAKAEATRLVRQQYGGMVVLGFPADSG